MSYDSWKTTPPDEGDPADAVRVCAECGELDGHTGGCPEIPPEPCEWCGCGGMSHAQTCPEYGQDAAWESGKEDA